MVEQKKPQSRFTLEFFETLISNLAQPFVELFYGIKKRTLPFDLCSIVGMVAALTILLRLDVLLLKRMGLLILYPTNTKLYIGYCLAAVTSGFWMWAVVQAALKAKLITRLKEYMKNCGLENRQGQTPRFIYDKPVDEFTRVLRISNACFPLQVFQEKREHLQASLRAHIDEIKADLGKGTVDIVYSAQGLATEIPVHDLKRFPKYSFWIGDTRSRSIVSNLNETPHVMVAGTTGKGKSTFLRQFITTMLVNNPKVRMFLVDLKGGLEFQLFENIQNADVIAGLPAAVGALQRLEVDLNSRMALLKANNAKDIEQYLKIKVDDRKVPQGFEKKFFDKLERKIVVVDEVADLFMVSSGVDAAGIQKARRIVSDIARKGRAVGLHLVLATQRPDAKAMDSQVKAQLEGVLCFPMVNDATSISVLGNGRATDLPSIKGRAIWKQGSDMTELQTPYLTVTEAERMLEALPAKSVSKELPKEVVAVQEEAKHEEGP